MYIYTHTSSAPGFVCDKIRLCVCMCNHIDWNLGGGARGPKAGNALQEVCVCVCMKWGTVVGGFVWARRWN